jgi:hypothetical protein
MKGAGDRLLTGGCTVTALAPGAGRSGTAKLTVPSATPLGTYFLLVCADDRARSSRRREQQLHGVRRHGDGHALTVAS